MRKYLALILILAGSSCVAQDGSGCVMLVPQLGLDPDGAVFERWQENRSMVYGDHKWGIENGEVLGYSVSESAPIWNREECIFYSGDI